MQRIFVYVVIWLTLIVLVAAVVFFALVQSNTLSF